MATTLYINTAATDLFSAAVVSSTDGTPVSNLRPIVLGDSELFEIFFMDGTAAESWSGDATYGCSIGLGPLKALGDEKLVGIDAMTPDGAAKFSGQLDLAAPALVDYAYRQAEQNCIGAIPLSLQVRVTTPAGYTETHALISISVMKRVFPET